MTDRGDKNILFTGCSLFKIRSSGVLTLFLNRPESPLENGLSGIVLSGGGKNDQNLLLGCGSSEVVHRVPLDNWQALGEALTRPAGGAWLCFHQIRLQVRLPSVPLLEALRGKEPRVAFSSGLPGGQCAFTMHVKYEFTVHT